MNSTATTSYADLSVDDLLRFADLGLTINDLAMQRACLRELVTRYRQLRVSFEEVCRELDQADRKAGAL